MAWLFRCFNWCNHLIEGKKWFRTDKGNFVSSLFAAARTKKNVLVFVSLRVISWICALFFDWEWKLHCKRKWTYRNVCVRIRLAMRFVLALVVMRFSICVECHHGQFVKQCASVHRESVRKKILEKACTTERWRGRFLWLAKFALHITRVLFRFASCLGQ